VREALGRTSDNDQATQAAIKCFFRQARLGSVKSSGGRGKNATVIDGQSGQYQEALTCWRSGDHNGTIALLAPLPKSEHTSASVLLLARAIIRDNRIRDARLWLASRALHRRNHDSEATHLMLLGVAEAREGAFDAAEALFQRARSCKPSQAVRAELEYERALAYFLAGANEQAREALRAVRPCDGSAYARALGLRGWLNCARDDYYSAHTEFGDAIATLDESLIRDAHLRASLVAALAMTTAELGHGPAERLVAEAAKVSWNASLLREHVQTLHHIGLAYRRDGLADEAMTTFLSAAELAPSSGWAVIALAQCAALSFELGEAVSTRGFLLLARRVADDIEWDAVSAEQRLALLMVAEILARLNDGVAATQYLEAYRRCSATRASRATTDVLCQHARLSIYLEHIEALIGAALGDKRGARVTLGRVHRAWSRIGHRWRARETLTDINRIDPKRARDQFLTASDEVHRQSHPTGYSQAALNRRSTAARGRREHLALRYDLDSRMANILNLVVQGRSNKDIAAAVTLSERTVKNKVCQLYRVVGITTAAQMKRAELIVRCTGVSDS
jgi:tetratricopeptide (TPR) repeat protein